MTYRPESDNGSVVLAGVCLFFSVLYCLGKKKSETIDKGDALMTNIVWIISIVVLVGICIKDSYCVKNNKAYELDITYAVDVDVSDFLNLEDQ